MGQAADHLCVSSTLVQWKCPWHVLWACCPATSFQARTSSQGTQESKCQMGQHASTANPAASQLSVIIPVLNEERNLESAIRSVRREKGVQPEVIVVDGGSTDASVNIAKRMGCRVLHSGRGRGRQQNLGWKAASRTWCMFLHADSRLPPNWLDSMQPLLQPCRVHQHLESDQLTTGLPQQWGCFMTIQTEWHDTWQGRILSAGVELRTRLLGQAYGDQALFARRSALEEVGGLPDWPLLEDAELARRLMATTRQRPYIVPLPVHTSGRRWQELGFWRTYAINQAVLLGWRVGVPPATLATWYYSAASRKPQG